MDPLQKMAAFQPTRKAFSLYEEFKNFAFKGSVIDLAVGVIIGAAFGKIISSLVDNIMTPLIGFVLPHPEGLQALTWRGVAYGKFLADVLTFVITALAIFLFIVKFLGWVMRSRQQEAASPPPLTKDQELLLEIRDLLARQQPDGKPAAGSVAPVG